MTPPENARGMDTAVPDAGKVVGRLPDDEPYWYANLIRITADYRRNRGEHAELPDTPTCQLENGYECCVYCWTPFGGDESDVPYPGFGGGLHYSAGPVVDAITGTRMETIAESPPGRGKAHPECYEEWNEDRRSL
jgi:hypothetical protein